MSGIISPYALTSTPIQGGLSVGNAGANLFQGTPVGSQYAGAYNNALSANMQNYQNILQGYQQTRAQQTGAQQAIQGGYNQLYNNVLGTLGLGGAGAVGAGGSIDWSKVDPTRGAAGISEGAFGIGTGAARAIGNTFVSNQGNVTQQMQNAGLSNTSAVGNAYNQNAFQSQEALGNLGNMLAQTGAGYMSQLGQAGLNYANQANMQNTALAGQQLRFQQGVQIPYPSAAAYGSVLGYRRGAGVNPPSVVNPFGSPSAGSQGHIPFGPGLPSPPGAAIQGSQPNTGSIISRALSTGANTTASAASYGMSEGDYANWVATGSPTDAQGNPTDSYGQPLNQSPVDQYMQPQGGFDQMFGQDASSAYQLGGDF